MHHINDNLYYITSWYYFLNFFFNVATSGEHSGDINIYFLILLIEFILRSNRSYIFELWWRTPQTSMKNSTNRSYILVDLHDFSLQNTQNIYGVTWSRIKVNYKDSSENNTICPSNHWQLLYLSTYLSSNAKKTTKNIAKNIIWWCVITTSNLKCCLSSSNTVARS